MSEIIESLRSDPGALVDAGAIGKESMLKFDAICPPPAGQCDEADINQRSVTVPTHPPR